MKKALFAALCFVVVSLVLVNGTFGLPNLDEVFADLRNLLDGDGLPEKGGAGTPVHVALISDDSQRLYPGGAASRNTVIHNKGSGAVYCRLVYAIQYDAESWPLLDISFDAGEGFKPHDWQDITIDGTPYKMKVFTYTQALAAGEKSPNVRLTIAMDTAVTSQQISRYRDDFLQTQVLAIDPTSFEKVAQTAEEALNLALPLDTLNPF